MKNTLESRPWVLIAIFALISLYGFYAIYVSAMYFVSVGHSLRDMDAYIPGFLFSIFCGAVSVGLYFRKKPAEFAAKWAGGGLISLVKPTSPTWIFVTLLILSWFANAYLSLFFWSLSVGNTYAGYSFLVSNLLSIVLSCWLFSKGKRIASVKCTWSVVPLTLAGWFVVMAVQQ